jgi:hypothetical protein
VDGRQYVAVSSGAALVAGGILDQVPNVTAPLRNNVMYVFALPE